MSKPSLTIRSKIVFILILSILVSSLMVAFTSDRFSQEIIETRLLESELPNIVRNINIQIDSEISQMATIAKQLATDPYTLGWAINGRSVKNEAILVNKLQALTRQFELSSASFSHRETADYWNNSGYLRQLKRNSEDGWFYAYRDSGKAEAVSLYIYPDGKKMEVFVNYQQLNGLGLAGVAKSFDDMAQMLNEFTIEKSGYVYLVDASGDIKLHQDKSLIGSGSLASLYGQDIANKLLNQTQFSLSESVINKQATVVVSSYIPSMDWYIIASVPKQEIFGKLQQARNRILVMIAIIIAVGVSVAIVFILPITRQIEQLVHTFQKLSQDDANLNARLELSGQKELDAIAIGFNQFLDNLKGTMLDVKSLSDQLKQVAAQVNLQSTESSSVASEHTSATSEVAGSLQQIDAAVGEVAENAANAAENAGHALGETQTAKDHMDITRQTLDGLSGQIGNVEEGLQQLNQSGQEITAVLDVINSIAEQTNLLALNAAIEAARAGEHGRGFSVVADEVRQLSKRTSDSIEDIQQLISRLNSNSGAVVSQITEMINQSHQVSSEITLIDDVLMKNHTDIEAINDINRSVASATEEQSAVINNVNTIIQDLNEKTDTSREIATKLATSSNELAALADELDNNVSQFVQ